MLGLRNSKKYSETGWMVTNYEGPRKPYTSLDIILKLWKL